MRKAIYALAVAVLVMVSGTVTSQIVFGSQANASTLNCNSHCNSEFDSARRLRGESYSDALFWKDGFMNACLRDCRGNRRQQEEIRRGDGSQWTGSGTDSRQQEGSENFWDSTEEGVKLLGVVGMGVGAVGILLSFIIRVGGSGETADLFAGIGLIGVILCLIIGAFGWGGVLFLAIAGLILFVFLKN